MLLAAGTPFRARYARRLQEELAEAGIHAFEFDAPIAHVYAAAFPRRLMVLEADLSVAREICPEHLPPQGE